MMLRRFNKTFLTDAELAIFDSVFNCYCLLPLLRKDIFQDVFNLNYSHELNDKELVSTIKKLADGGFLRLEGDNLNIEALTLAMNYYNPNLKLDYYNAQNRIFVTLTLKGGELWELERNPNWNFYCKDSWDVESNILEVSSPSYETAAMFLETAKNCQIYTFVEQEVSYQKSLEDHTFIPWKKFDCVYTVAVHLKNNEVVITDWSLYHKQRRWWRSIEELFTFQ